MMFLMQLSCISSSYQKKCDNSVDPGMLYVFGFYKGAFFCNLEIMKPKPPLPGACQADDKVTPRYFPATGMLTQNVHEVTSYWIRFTLKRPPSALKTVMVQSHSFGPLLQLT